jgi:hypothetical protein
MPAISLLKIVLGRLPRALVYLAFGNANDLAESSQLTAAQGKGPLGKSAAETALETVEDARAARQAKKDAQ